MLACLILTCLNFNSHVSAQNEKKKKKKVMSTFYIYYQFYLFFTFFFYVYHFFLSFIYLFFLWKPNRFLFLFSQFSFLLSCIFLVTKRYTLQLYVIHWNPPVKDSQSQVSHGLILIYILHMVAPRQSGANTNAAPTLHALTRKGLPLPLARKLQRKLVTTEILFFFFSLRKTEIQI